jgi:SPP1 family predicted phage head-tail adaptor
MRAGVLDRRVTILEPIFANDSAGQPIATWSIIATVWMQQVPKPGAERFAAQQVIGQAVMTWRCRWRTDLTVKHRLRDEDGRIYEIVDIRELKRRDGLEIDTTARSDD